MGGGTDKPLVARVLFARGITRVARYEAPAAAEAPGSGRPPCEAECHKQAQAIDTEELVVKDLMV